MRTPEEMLLVVMILHNCSFVRKTNEFKILLKKTKPLISETAKNLKGWQILNKYVETLVAEIIDSGFEVDYGTAIDYENVKDELEKMLKEKV